MLLEALFGNGRASKAGRASAGCEGQAALVGAWRRKGFSVHVYLCAVTAGGGEAGNYSQTKPDLELLSSRVEEKILISADFCQTCLWYCIEQVWMEHQECSACGLAVVLACRLIPALHRFRLSWRRAGKPGAHLCNAFPTAVHPACQWTGWQAAASHSPWQNIFLFLCNSFWRRYLLSTVSFSQWEPEVFCMTSAVSWGNMKTILYHFLQFLRARNCWYAALLLVFLQTATWEIPVLHMTGAAQRMWPYSEPPVRACSRFCAGGHRTAERLCKGSAGGYPGAGLRGRCWWAGAEDAAHS